VFTEAVPAAAPAVGRARVEAGCAAVCRRLAEPMIGTAPPAAAGWLLIGHSGPWPAHGLPPDLPGAVTRMVDRLTEHGVRTQLVRRPDRTGRQGETQAVLIAGGPPGARWLERRDLRDPRVLGDLDPAGFGSGTAPGFGEPVAAALLVCTHGRREVCCAKYGRPVARALAAHFAPLVWETTHVGGDRFAANLVVLPSGAYYGRLDPQDAVRAAQAALDGRVELDRFRGTAGLPEPVQAAECLLRRALGVTATDAVRYLPTTAPCDSVSIHTGSTHRSPRRYTIRFAVRGAGVHTVTLERHEAAGARLTSCGTGAVEAPAGFRLVAVAAATAATSAG
jgi:(2Fe-2S) ferredoxin